MILPDKRRILFFGGLLACTAVLVMLMLWAFSSPRRPLEYMVAGTFATALVLVGAFLLLVKRRWI